MRSRVEVVADVADDGTPVLARMHAQGALAVRRTGPGTVHLVGTAAGPLGGDVVEIDLVVRAGARLELAGVAATIALPGPAGDVATWDVTADVADGATLRCAPQPLVVSRGARLRTTTRLALAPSAAAEVVEQVVLGRYGEDGGTWSGRLVADVGGVPAVRQTQSSRLLCAGPRTPGEPVPRALVSRLLLGAATTAGPTTSGNAVACPLAVGGTLLTAFGADLGAALRDLAAAWRTTPVAPVAAG
jgi:urease accessory protein